jgi:plastocyanin
LRGVRRALVAAVGGALLVPGALLAADEPPTTASAPAGAPAAVAANPTDGAPATPRMEQSAAVIVAALAPPAQGVAGEPVRLDASGSSGPIVSYRWDLDGDGSFETDGGTQPVLEHAFDTAGTIAVGVQVAGADGTTDDVAQQLTVTDPAPKPEPKPTPQPDTKPAAAGPSDQPGDAAPAQAKPAKSVVNEKTSPKPKAKQPTVHSAASHSVTIKNFAFSPGTINVSQGDTITWTNQDSAPHTATGSGGTFNTGNLDEGQSGSATFSNAGTFSYFCAVHPFMKGTVVVAAAGGGSSGGSSSGAGSTPSATTPSGTTDTPSASAPTDTGGLPQTGVEVLAIALVGAVMTLSGLLLRRLATGIRAAISPRG